MDLALSLLIPTFNEQDIILHALQEIQKELGPEFTRKTELIIVDDGKDQLPQIVESAKKDLSFANVLVKRHTPGLGKGQSLVWGFQHAQAPVVGFMDVDLSTPPRYIKMAYDTVASGKSDIFIGSRKALGSKVERDQFFLKDILGHALGVIARGIIFSGMRNYQDTQCGFKFYKKEVAQTLYRDLVAPDGLNDLEILIKANLIGFKVFEQGVEWTDLRESKRALRRILVGEIKAMIRILYEYKFFSTARRKTLLKLRRGHN